jgi:hypothetical protein
VLACAHDHLIFTRPDELRGLWLANVRVMTARWLTTVRATLLELLAAEPHLGAAPGIIAALHTWSQTVGRPPPLHCVVTGGGVTSEGQWCPVRQGVLLPVRGVRAVFRGPLRHALRRAGSQGQLELPAGMSSQRWANRLNTLGRPKWHGPMRERYAHGTGVLIELARYLRGGPRSNQRLVASADGEVTCRYRVHGAASDRKPRGRMTWPIAEVSRRSLLPAPEPGTRVVRCDGLCAPTKRAALAACRAQRGQGRLEAPVVLDGQTAGKTRGDAHPERCPQGGRLRSCGGVILPARSPPPAARPWEVVA